MTLGYGLREAWPYPLAVAMAMVYGHRAAAVGSDDLRHLCPPERLVYRSFWLAARTSFPWDALLPDEHRAYLCR
ncbi:mechanosensitive ion channel family protein [Escherichia coli]|uniref:Mechanosensitive ion channel family protein n=1 Tax=Escherichia coli TaxID=562 RepID=A0A377ASB3_ECOLX|nr:mechanosensitive ion channel family protein [Escherichia coli]